MLPLRERNNKFLKVFGFTYLRLRTLHLVTLVCLILLWVFLRPPPAVTVHEHDSSGSRASLSSSSSSSSFSVHPKKNHGHRHRHRHRYAYAFVICGVWPQKPSYRGFVYNVLVSTKILREESSTADVVLLVQMDYRTTAAATKERDDEDDDDDDDNNIQPKLPEKDEAWLTALGIHIYYIPPSKDQNFYNCMLEKFRILELTEYQRVLFLDGDVMPLANLDYFFHLSDHFHDDDNNNNNHHDKPPLLMENLVVAGRTQDPATGGFFMLTPKKGDYQKLLEIVEERERNYAASSAAASASASATSQEIKFDPVQGWGHVITPPDQWISKTDSGTLWDFSFAYADPGLLYHWTKYVKKSVSIVVHNQVYNFGASNRTDNAVVELRQILKRPFANYSRPRFRIPVGCEKWLCVFYHFSGHEKPWMFDPPPYEEYKDGPERFKYAAHHWFYMLDKINTELNMQLDFNHWSAIAPGKPTLGTWPTPRHINHRVEQHQQQQGKTAPKGSRNIDHG